MKLVQLAIFTGLLQLCSVAHDAAPPERVLLDILTAVSSCGTPLPSIVSQLLKAAPSAYSSPNFTVLYGCESG